MKKMNRKRLIKLLQRQLYDTFSRKYSPFSFFIFICLVLFIPLIIFQKSQENIHFVHWPVHLYHSSPIDVVYTWVNGSDPLLIKQLIKTKFALKKKYNIKYDQIPDNHCPNEKNYFYLEAPFNLLSDHLISDTNLLSSSDKINQVIKIYKNQTLVYFESINEVRNHLNLNNTYNSTLSVFIKMSCNSLLPLSEADPYLNVITSSSLTLITGVSHLSNRQFLRLFTPQQRDLIRNIFHYPNHNLTLLILNVQKSKIIQTIYDRLKTTFQKRNKVTIHSNIKLVVGDYNFFEKLEHIDDDFLAKRFADNGELRYSLRSLEKFAPWVRYVFIVTNGQIPSWLNLNNKRIKIITHEEIFVNKNDLPTFNSAAIECHLHRIPYLSENFVYMNDDILLGKPVYPEDFYSHNKGYNIYLSWSLPNCKPGCPISWLNDGFCDISCNTSSCSWDGGDCLLTSSNSNIIKPPAPKNINKDETHYCSLNCLNTWLADRFCDRVCNTIQCGFDMGDCGLTNYYQLPSQFFFTNQSLYQFPSSSAIYLNLTHFLTNNSNSILNAYYDNNLSVKLIIINIRLQVLAVLLQPNVTQSNITMMIMYQHSHSNLNITCELRIGLSDGLVFEDKANILKDVYSNTSIVIDKNDINYTTISDIPFYKREPQVLYNISKSIEDMRLIEIINTLSESQRQMLNNKLEKFKEMKMNEYLTKKGLLYAKYQAVEEIMNRPSNEKEDTKGSLPWERSGFFDYISKQIEIYEKYKQDFKKRRLLDTYGDSLLHVNQIYNQEFGFKVRKVPAHMAHYINKNIMNRLHQKFEKQFKSTSSHKVRSSIDMQFAFSYYYFLMSETYTRDIDHILQLFDTDHSGFLSLNELRSMIVNLYDLPLLEKSIDEFNHRLSTCLNQTVNITSSKANENISIGRIKECTNVTNELIIKLGQVNRNEYQILSDEEISFQMVRSNASLMKQALDELRKSTTKFICFNDDMDYNDEEESRKVRLLLNQFYQYYFPLPSVFEHPSGIENQFQNVQEYKEWQKSLQLKSSNSFLNINIIIILILIILFYILQLFFFNFAFTRLLLFYRKQKRKSLKFKHLNL